MGLSMGARIARDAVVIDRSCGSYSRSMAAMLPSASVVDFANASPDECTRWLSGADVAIVGVWRDDGAHTAPLVAMLRRRDPRVTIYVCGNGVDLSRVPVRAFAVAGADDLVTITSSSEITNLVEAIRKRRCTPAPARELQQLTSKLPRGVPAVVALHCVRNGVSIRNEDQVARWFGVTVQTLNNQLRSIAMPSAGVCIRCGVEFHRAELLRRGDLTREELARRLDLPSAGAMQSRRSRLVNALRRTKERGALLENLLVPADDA